MDEVVGRHRLDPNAVDGRLLPVFQNNPAPELGGAERGQDQLCFPLADERNRLQIEVIRVVVRDQDQVGLRRCGIVGVIADRVNMDDLPPEGEVQRGVADKGDLEIPGRGRQAVRLERPGGQGRRRRHCGNKRKT